MNKYLKLKRLADFFVALLAISLLILPMLPIAIWLRSTAEGRIFYRQLRVGYQNQNFYIWKFATMLLASPQMGTGSLTLRNDPRVTKPGRFLRKTKINELPQLFNVLSGEMSLVGPRPQMKEDFDVYPPAVQATIYRVKPGITGIGSIIFRDEERLLSQPNQDPKTFYAEHIAPYKGEVELWYQENCTLITDIKIIFLTIWVILFPSSKIWKSVFPTIPPIPVRLSSL